MTNPILNANIKDLINKIEDIAQSVVDEFSSAQSAEDEETGYSNYVDPQAELIGVLKAKIADIEKSNSLESDTMLAGQIELYKIWANIVR